jgi:hypothetical protein
LPRLSLWRENHSNDYKFQDRRILELFTAGGTGVNVNKYLGPNDQGTSTDYTKPSTANATETNIQDLLFLENRDRKYDRNVYNMRCHYTIQDTDFNLSQFGLFVTNDTLFFTFHINDMIERMGRKIMPGDVLELMHLRDYNPLDPNDIIPIALKKYYVVQETTRAAEGFAPTWWPHLWRCKAQPMVDGQEYRDILEQPAEDPNGNEYPNPLKDYLSTYSKNVNIDDAIIRQAEADVPLSGYDTSGQYVLPTDANGNPVISSSLNSDNTAITMDTDSITVDYTFLSPQAKVKGWLTGDGKAPNGLPVQALTYFPDAAVAGDYVLRVDYAPNRLFRFDGRAWVAIEDKVRAPLTGSNNDTLLGTFVNNTARTRLNNGTTVPERQALSTILTAKADQ